MRLSEKEFILMFPDHPYATELKSKKEKKKRTSAKTAVKKESQLEILFEQQLQACSIKGYEREYKFHPSRRWRMDFAWKHEQIAVEIEGGIWNHGRHNRPQGFIADTKKYNAAGELGWTVLRFTAGCIKSGDAVEKTAAILKSKGNTKDHLC